MGQFLSMSGVIGGDSADVAIALQRYAEENSGQMKSEPLTTDDDECLIISKSACGCTILYPHEFFAWDHASQFLSRQLQKPVFSFHIHDSDLWMYTLYIDGEDVDRFNPVPDYWFDELDDAETERWKGDAAVVCSAVPGLSQQKIEKYLVHWDDNVFESESRQKAYDTDEYFFGDDWQLMDFMKSLGLRYPVDDTGQPHGDTYRFRCTPKDVD